jgi:hypothetical protein
MNYAFDNYGVTEERLSLNVRVENANCSPVNVSIMEEAPVEIPFSLMGTKDRVAYAVVYSRDDTSHFVIYDDLQAVRKWYGLEGNPRDELLEMEATITLSGGLGISMIENVPGQAMLPRELMYLYISGVLGTYSSTNIYQKSSFMIQSIELNDQRWDAAAPRFIHRPEEDGCSWLTASYVARRGQLGNGRAQDCVQYLSVLLQPLAIRTDEEFLMALYAFSSMLFPENGEERELPPPETSPPVIYEKIHFHPIKLDLSFQVGSLKMLGSGNPLAVAARSLGVTLLNLEGVIIKLGSFETEEASVLDTTELSEQVQEFYMRSLRRQLYEIGLMSLGRLELIGDPVAVFRGIKGGVKDFFYEPAKGIVKSPKAFGEGLGRGTKSLGSSVLGGITGAGSKMTGAAARGLAVLTLDEEFQEKRARALRQQPKSVAGGVASGAKRLGTSLLEGVGGLFMQPVKQFQKDGVAGIFKGMGQVGG